MAVTNEKNTLMFSNRVHTSVEHSANHRPPSTITEGEPWLSSLGPPSLSRLEPMSACRFHASIREVSEEIRRRKARGLSRRCLATQREGAEKNRPGDSLGP
mmetsp:Transcript_28/g.60  ORF Transcript_28/g.60 Transcript_28/m.60 type:complete len:101 (-) Transcript_28:44-346(-)